MSFKKSSHNPLANCESNTLDQFINSSFILSGNSENGFEEEFIE